VGLLQTSLEGLAVGMDVGDEAQLHVLVSGKVRLQWSGSVHGLTPRCRGVAAASGRAGMAQDGAYQGKP
jgi:hypothetical protein